MNTTAQPLTSGVPPLLRRADAENLVSLHVSQAGQRYNQRWSTQP